MNLKQSSGEHWTDKNGQFVVLTECDQTGD